ncbi:bifunctional tRNA (5-methylaminomethyl-2-thiouridine)(34)-methyltransferase MnmD/FAD-dependent 5-carboxymethylaminomethyl-2-thiouridine(34) oxidoreductase MnmC [Vibrio salinus]|uniref:bifunctional tRNA (5-methylaminomethyl-2-thiouridine)(34)-methyltransferase MnmD/FAD-dependent 5-carboxymethylaminomethyl-2-thiouridine(34) oxidoreductase MnmC n=1 Tax=Vibrio salinus TaxID=2899784 RepID=UPI001E62283B|nr:bifunctional tRNA (5-methylaminomethyl-2-thiouridine)(34)-methyltransferase MnmD/FAD-dependent 5-carboxymethylaminomethyl-2-thiouridine(34) oxidoreductase MnmC [Vibrio salinus]MCE0494542.1 bifunctional tRNA (5-methylaminomethyl-2-thiouridine)(34)-methyltransferase MnmD/FAD-dependent 5-carboxymethylaminomethyl-2-thiouridine(34) oxidoreductase MnmC [Vibrio salinus]
MASITNANIDWNASGTPVSDQFDDVYFSNVNGLAETQYVFLHQNHLPERWNEFSSKRFVIGETGFGTGLNFLAAWQLFDDFRLQNPESVIKELHFISFEKFPIQLPDLIRAHDAWPQLKKYASELQKYYPIAVPGCHRVVLAGGLITLDLWFGDIKDCMPQIPVSKNGIIDAWFLDGFAPSKNPEMWNQNLFNNMANLSKNNATCATFTAAGFVRRGLIEAGYDMKKVKGFGTKREMIAGTLSHKARQTNVLPWYRSYPTSELKDVAIIGGGIASACLAKSLVQRGIHVTLYCKDSKVAQGASGNRQGAIYPLLTKNNDEISRIFSSAFLFARQSVRQAATTLDFDHDWCGVTQIMWDDKSTKKLNNIVDGDYHPELITKLDKRQTESVFGLNTDTESLSYPLGGWLCPAQFTGQMLKALESTGNLTIRYQHEVTDVTRRDNQWYLHVNEQSFRHQSVVFANGNEFNKLSQAKKLPLAQVKGQVSHIPTTPVLSKIRTVLCYDGYMTPCNPENQHHCIGASYDKHHLDTVFDPAAQQENKQKLVHCLPAQQWTQEVNVEGNQSRQGIRCVSRDHLPFVGNLSAPEIIKEQYADLVNQTPENAKDISCYPDLYAFLGLGSRGLCSAPLLAEYLASLMADDPLPFAVDLTEKLHPSRMWIRKLRKGKKVD